MQKPGLIYLNDTSSNEVLHCGLLETVFLCNSVVDI